MKMEMKMTSMIALLVLIISCTKSVPIGDECSRYDCVGYYDTISDTVQVVKHSYYAMNGLSFDNTLGASVYFSTSISNDGWNVDGVECTCSE
jgi:hypothetical protein